ncbi:MAG: transglutaminase family protein [Wujia sp.]
MDQIKFSYEMEILFGDFIHEHHFTLRCFPKKSVRQNILEMHTEVSPYDMLCESWDGFGNTTFIGYKKDEHKRFSVSVDGIATVDWSRYETDTNLNMCYKIQTPYTMPSHAMHDFFNQHFARKMRELTEYAMAEYIMHTVHEHFTYCKQVTTVNTVAAAAFDLKKGVCQDYAHVMLTFARMALLPARYVVGLMIGEGESHAWVEVFCKGRWYGFDPTNDALIGNNYIIISKGRDCKDCIMNQGKFYGTGDQKQTIKAKVEIIDGTDDCKGGASGRGDTGNPKKQTDV